MNYDVLIVGSGLFGATCAYELTNKGFRCLVLEKRSHIGGNCYTERCDGINVHRYGPHIFHTSSRPIWDWINRFATFNSYRHRVKVRTERGIFSYPINLSTFHRLWGVNTPEEAQRRLEQERIQDADSTTLEGWSLSQLGRELYDMFIRDYTIKQWNTAPAALPASIIQRIPIRLTFDDGYFDDIYQGIPVGGYTQIFDKLLTKCDVRLNVDYFEERRWFDSLAHRVIYTGPIDRFFEYRFGRLAYRSVDCVHEQVESPDFQGIAQMNYAALSVPFTRIVEHKHFEGGKQSITWITREYPAVSVPGCNETYPIRDADNVKLLGQYKALRTEPRYRHYWFGGRLAEYQYYDMHQVIASALHKVTAVEADLLGRGTPDLASAVQRGDQVLQ